MSNVREVSPEDARRIAVRAQLLDGSATSVLETVRLLGFLQLDPISTVAPPQHLVLWSRLGSAYDRDELDQLIWDERMFQLFGDTSDQVLIWVPQAGLSPEQLRLREDGYLRRYSIGQLQ